MMGEQKKCCGELLCVSGEEAITSDTAAEIVVKYSCAQDRRADSPERGTSAMTREEASSIISVLTPGEYAALSELLIDLEQNRALDLHPLAEVGKVVV